MHRNLTAPPKNFCGRVKVQLLFIVMVITNGYNVFFFFFCPARYCDDPEQAEVFYHHALVLVPSNGMENFKFLDF